MYFKIFIESSFKGIYAAIKGKLQRLLHGPPVLVDKTNFGLVLYNRANFYRSGESSSYWSVKLLCFSLVNSNTSPASQCIAVQ